MNLEVELPKLAEEANQNNEELEDNISNEEFTLTTQPEDESEQENFENLQKIYEEEEFKPPTTIREKIFVGLEKPSSSRIAFLISLIVLFFILLSTMTFMLSTLPEWVEVSN